MTAVLCNMIHLNTRGALAGNANLLGEVLSEKFEPATLISTRQGLGSNAQHPVMLILQSILTGIL